MFLNEWESLAAEFGWTSRDIFNRDGLAYWLETELVTLGPEHAVTERDRVYDKVTRTDWVNAYAVALAA
jgi:hypothetical protein